MDAWQRLISFWDREWQGDSLNGRCLREELGAHTAIQACDTHTVEGYSVWSIALHVHRYKELYLAALERRPPNWPEGDQDFPPVPAEGLEEVRWRTTLATLSIIHDRLASRARSLTESFLDGPFAGGPLSWGEGLISVFTHDFYHVAQIRSMKR